MSVLEHIVIEKNLHIILCSTYNLYQIDVSYAIIEIGYLNLELFILNSHCRDNIILYC